MNAVFAYCYLPTALVAWKDRILRQFPHLPLSSASSGIPSSQEMLSTPSKRSDAVIPPFGSRRVFRQHQREQLLSWGLSTCVLDSFDPKRKRGILGFGVISWE